MKRNVDMPYCANLNSAQRYYIEHGCNGLGFVVDKQITKVPYRSSFEKWLFSPAPEWELKKYSVNEREEQK